MDGGCGGLHGRGVVAAVVAEDVGERVEEAARGHERFTAGDGEVEEGGGGVLLGEGCRGVECFREVGDCALVGDYGSDFRVVLGEEAELAEGGGSGLVGYGAQL